MFVGGEFEHGEFELDPQPPGTAAEQDRLLCVTDLAHLSPARLPIDPISNNNPGCPLLNSVADSNEYIGAALAITSIPEVTMSGN